MPSEPAHLQPGCDTLTFAMRRIAAALAERLPAVDTLPAIAEEARAVLGAATVVVGLREEEEFLRFRAVAGERANELQGVRIRAAESTAEHTLRTGQPWLSDHSVTAETGHGEPLGMPSPLPVASAPIETDGQAIGALLAMRGDGDPHFSRGDLDILSLLATCVAAAVSADESDRDRVDQARELSVLYRASRSVGASLNLQEILDSVLSAVCDHLDYQTATVFLANDEQTHLFIAAERGLADADRDLQLGAEEPPVAEILAAGHPRVLTRSDHPELLDAFVRDERIRAALVAPIRSRAECHGVILVTSPQPENFTESDLELMEAVAANAGIAISNAWLYEDATQRAENAGALYDLSQKLNATLDADDVYSMVVDTTISLLHADSAAVLALQPDGGRLSCRQARGAHADRLLEYSAAVGAGIAGWVHEWETPQAVAHVAADPRNCSAPLDSVGVSSVLVVPMVNGERALGVLLAATAHRRLFTVGEMEMLYTVANQAAVTLTKAELYAQTRAKASELRRYFRRTARALGEAVQGDDVPVLFADLALAMMRGAECNIYRLQEDTLVPCAMASDRGTTAAAEAISVGQGLTGAVARRGQVLAVDALAGDPRLELHPWAARQRFTSYLGVPLKIGRAVRGVVEVFTREPHANLRDEARLLAQFARLARIAERLS